MLKDVGAYDRIPKQEILDRIDKLKGLMAEAHMEYAFISEKVDRFYFSGTAQKGVIVIPIDEEPLCFIEKGMERAQAETPLSITPVRNDREIGNILADKGILSGVAGLELDVLPVSTFERLKRTIGFDRYVDVSPVIKELKAVKSAFELEQIRKSGLMLPRIFAKAREIVREGITEMEIDATLIGESRRAGHQGLLRMRGFNQEMTLITVQSGGYGGTIPTCADAPIAGSGITPALPQGSTFRKVERGIPVTIDYGGAYNGYVTDETRVFVAGELKGIFRKPYEVARDIIADAAAFGREGVDCTDIFARAYRMVEKAGLQEYFMGHGEGQVSFIGHGLGLEINELPVITARHSRILKEGMVFAFEPKFVLPPYGAIGVEVDFIVKADRLERVTDDSLDIVYV
jgi:Xaa-Pro dipeptidase